MLCGVELRWIVADEGPRVGDLTPVRVDHPEAAPRLDANGAALASRNMQTLGYDAIIGRR